MAASSSSSSQHRWEYDVFLSFRGEDTRKSFIDHLYRALDQRGIRTFKDDEKLERGKSISLELVKNINESGIAVIVFSKNYASSSWCLDELVEILECRRTKGQIVLPIFYHVKPRHVRKQKRSFAEAFREHEEIHKEETKKVQRWRDALKEAANISGMDLEDETNGYEDKFIQEIVQVISKNLQPKPFRVAEHEVGIDSRANKIIMLLSDRSEDKLFVGICGMGGIGKTTVAKAVFNQISNKFERSCLLENVREKSTKHGGLAKIQQELLRETLMDNNLRISNSDRGINEIKDRLQHKNILIVLDDVDHEKQLTDLVGLGQDWFGSESRIIITTRQQRLLTQYNVKIYQAELLSNNEALELFSCHAFKQNNPIREYLTLSHRIIDYAKGLPLALKVLGSFLYGRSIPEWESELDKLKSNPPKEIQDILRISYDGLDKSEKAIFLDIACFFKGYDKKFATDFVEGCGFHSVIGINVLIERSLVTISDNKFWMHDLIQEMGQEIVRQESEDPERRSRLWSYEDIHKVFTKNTVTEKIEAIMLSEKELYLGGDVAFLLGEFHVSADAFTKMRKLRMLKITGVQLLGSLTYLSNELRYLDWNGYSGEYLPSNFHPKKLVRLHLRHSLINEIWTNTKFLYTLKVLDLGYCKNLRGKNLNFSGFPLLEELCLTSCKSLVEVEFDDTKILDKLKVIKLDDCEKLKKTPNLSRVPCLEVLHLQGCRNLVEVHPSIEYHERLVELNLNGCKNLKSVATKISLKFVTTLLLNECSKLEKFPEIQGDMECLKELYLMRTAIKELPSSIVKHLKGLRVIYLIQCKVLESLPNNIGEMKNLKEIILTGSGIKYLPPSIEHLKELENLDLTDCNMLENLPSNFGEMNSLELLSLNGSGIKDLPPSVEHLKGLQSLSLMDCKMLGSLPNNIGGMKSLKTLSLNGSAIKDLPSSVKHLKHLRVMSLRDCKLLGNLPSSIGEMESLESLDLGGSGIKVLPSSITLLPSLEMLYWDSCNLDEESFLNLPHCRLRYLDIRSNNFASLPPSITQLPQLGSLMLNGCLRLQTLDSLPSSIYLVDAQGCVSLEQCSFPKHDCSSYNYRYWFFIESHKLVENHGNNKPDIYYPESQLQEFHELMVLPGSEVPSWFSHKYECGEEGSVRLRVDIPNTCSNIKVIASCVVIGIDSDDDKKQSKDQFPLYLHINGRRYSTGLIISSWMNNIISDHLMLSHLPIKDWICIPDECCCIEVSINPLGSTGPSLKVKKWGIHLVMDSQK